MDMKCRDKHEAGEQCRHRTREQADDQQNSAKELQTPDVIGPE
jgi:hypothetical protein